MSQGIDQRTGPGMSRRRLLRLGALSATASPALLRPRRAAAQIGGAQPTAPDGAGGRAQEPGRVQGPKVKASSPTTLSFWQYVGFHVDVQKFIAEEYKKRHDPNVSLEITAYPGLNEQRVGVKSALAAQSPTPDIIAVEPGAYAVDVSTSGSVLDFTKVFAEDPDYKKGFWPNALELLTINGAVVSVPAVTNTVIVYYNRALFRQHGLEVPEHARRAQEDRRGAERQGHHADRLPGRAGPQLPDLPLLHVRGRDQGRQADARGRSGAQAVDQPGAGGGRGVRRDDGEVGALRQGAARHQGAGRHPDLRHRALGDVLGRPVDAPLDPRGAAAGLRPGPLPLPRRGRRRPQAGAELGRDHADGERAEQAPRSRVRDDQGHHRRLGQDRVHAEPRALAERADQRRGDRLPDAVAQGSALSRVPQAAAHRHHAGHLHAGGRGGDDPGDAGAHHGAEDTEGRDGVGGGGLAEGRRRGSSGRAEARAGAPDHRPAPLAAPRGGLRLRGARPADPGGVPALPHRLLAVAEPARVGRLHAAVGAVRRPRELSRAGRRRGLLAGHAELHRLRRRADAAGSRPRLPAGPAAEPPAGRPLAAAHALLRAGRHVADRGDDHLPARVRAEHRPAQHVPHAPSGWAPGRIPGSATPPPRCPPSSRSACGRTWGSAW